MPPLHKREREVLKRELEDHVASFPQRVEIATPKHWAVSGIKDPVGFLSALATLIPDDAQIYIEGTAISPAAERLHKQHSSSDIMRISPDTIFPKPKTFHLKFSLALCSKLGQLAAENASETLFDHIKCYTKGTLIFSFHDAFCGVLRISLEIPENKVSTFCSDLHATYAIADTELPSIQPLSKLLEMMKSAEK